MIRVLGDVAYPYQELLLDVDPKIKALLINCEGYLVEGSPNKDIVSGVSNNAHAIKSLGSGSLVVGLANNHVMDSPKGATESVRIAKKNGHITVGAGANLIEACSPAVIKFEMSEVAILCFGWKLIGCMAASSTREGVAPMKEKLIKGLVEEQRKMGRKVLLFLHWGYELEIYPLPGHREMAKRLIEAGADIIVGCHSHCLQGYENYNGRPIFYGIGNAIFEEGYYFNGRLSFPEFCSLGLAVNWEPDSNRVSVSDVMKDGNKVNINREQKPEEHEKLMSLSTFSGISDDEYVHFFIKNRRKRNALPIFKERDDTFLYFLKSRYVMLRATLIGLLFKVGLKGQSR